jgi:nitrate reductase delta subunit
MTPLSIYRILSALLDYPDEPLVAALDEIETALTGFPDAARELAPLVAALRGQSLIESQQVYVATFDRNPRHSLYLFEHVHGESRARGEALVDLLDEYRRHDVDVASNELPDYVPLFLEVLGLLDDATADALLADAIHVLAAIGERLERDASPYAAIFTVLRARCAVEPQPLAVAPVRDMDEALERFGPLADGTEPLPGAIGTVGPVGAAGGAQPVRFHPRATRPAAPGAATAKEWQ